MRRVLTFYRFVAIEDPPGDREQLLALGEELDLKGTILVAHEGVNGTLVGTSTALEAMRDHLLSAYGEFPFKWSDVDADNPAFYRYKVKIKDEIVTFGVPDLDVSRTGTHVDAERWNELLNDPDVTVVDTRNQYEIDIGTFPGALSPATESFREFPTWAAANLSPGREKKIAMFCTGGIRCEKASAHLLASGFETVYQLDGGILKYLEDVDTAANHWEGECFVFDQRVSVTKDLEQGRYEQCYACRHPLSASDLESSHFEQGVSCPHCHDGVGEERLAGLRERQRQVQLAEARGERHIGAPQASSQQRFEEPPDRIQE